MPNVLTISCPSCRTVDRRTENPVPSPNATTFVVQCKGCPIRYVATIKPDWSVMVFPVGKGKSGHYDNRCVVRPPPRKPEIKLTPPKPKPTAGAVLSKAGAC